MAETNGEVDKNEKITKTEEQQQEKETTVEKKGGEEDGSAMEIDSAPPVKEEKEPSQPIEAQEEKKGEGEDSSKSNAVPSADVKMENGDDDEEDDDDDIPLSQLKKKAPATEPTPAPKEDKSGDGGDDDDDNDDDDEDIPLSQLKKAPPPKKTPPPKKATTKTKKAPAKKKVVESDDEEDDDDEDIPLSQLRKKPAAPKKKVVDDDEDDSEDDTPISQLASLKNAPPRRRAATASKKKDVSESEEESDVDEKPKKKAPAKKKATTTRVKKETKRETKKKGSTTSKSKKDTKDSKAEVKETRAERKMREEDEARHKWWLETPDLAEDEKWKSLKHAGVLFAPLYVPHGVKVLYDGKPVELTPAQEEYATYYAQYLETDHVKKEVFRQNFWKCWKKLLQPKKGPKSVITNFDKVNFRPIWSHLEQRKEVRKNRTKAEKDEEKKEKALIAEKYGFAELDGVKERVGNYRVEPPGLFLGRGAHPKAGMFKNRITPEDITINIGPGEEPPRPSEPYEDREFENVITNNKVTWLATWRENVNNNTKYVMLHSSSRLKGEADMKKFEVARQLKDNVTRIRKEYMANLTSKSPEKRQFATAMWVIDRLALRVGNEKGEDEADTVGCCSLRVEHVRLVAPSSIEFDFLGKDSMRYFNTVEVDKKIYDNFEKFIHRKKKTDDVFDRLNSVSLNAHLKKYMDGLSAKVFRTFNASYTLEKELAKVKIPKGATVEEKVFEFNKANREVAILCNHQRSQSKQHGVQMEKIDEKMDQIKQEIKAVRQHKKKLRDGKVEEEKPKSRKRKREDDEDEDEPEKKRARMPKTMEKCDETTKRLQERLKKWELKKTEKDEMKTIALNTSKVNYIDPRLCVAWCKRNDVPVEKIFSKLLRDKFAWAMGVDEDWKF